MLMPHTGLLLAIAGISQHQGRSLYCKVVAVKVLMGGKVQRQGWICKESKCCPFALMME